ncbi:MAG: hypothetical protein IJY09_00125 [Lachnospiraceae bacterium]|nr:hypothetical protein [Lachnospiraceae bacterium]
MFERNALGSNAKKMKIQYSGFVLKVIAAVMTIIGTVGVAILQNGVMNLDGYSTESLLEAMKTDSDVMGMSTLIVVCSGIASLALPMYVLQLIEGYRHTASYKNYLLRIGALAVISEVPYDLAMKDAWFTMDSQNPVFGLLIALLMIYFLDYVSEVPKFRGVMLKFFIVVAAVLWTVLFSIQSGLVLILVTAVMWIFAGNGMFTTFMAASVSILRFPAPFGFIFNHFYNGEKGAGSRKLFYVLYPLQLLVLGLVGKYCL